MVDRGAYASAAPELRVCPFLRAQVDASLVDPLHWPDPANRCVALGDPAPQSLRQQEYACLASSHVNCPRFRRGLPAIEQAADDAAASGRSGMRLTPAIAGALVVLAASFVLSVGFVVANGGMDLRTAAGGAGPSGSPASGAPAPSASADVEGAAATPTPEPTPTPAPSPSPTSEPTPRPTPSSTPEVTPTPSSDRYALLRPCGDEADCWIYEVRLGDNLVSIANYFGVPLSAVYERNPWAETEQLRPGQELRLPPPTR